MYIMALYGMDMCLINATYKTTAYNMPLFFLFDPTHVGNVNAAAFLLTDEQQESTVSAPQ